MSEKIITKEWLGARVRSEFGLQTKLARHLQLHKTAVSKMIHGRRSISQEEAIKIRTFFKEHFGHKAFPEQGGVQSPPSSVQTDDGSSMLPGDVERCIHAIVGEFNPELAVLTLQKDEHALVQEAVEIFVRLYAPDPNRAKDVETLSRVFGINARHAR